MQIKITSLAAILIDGNPAGTIVDAPCNFPDARGLIMDALVLFEEERAKTLADTRGALAETEKLRYAAMESGNKSEEKAMALTAQVEALKSERDQLAGFKEKAEAIIEQVARAHAAGDTAAIAAIAEGVAKPEIEKKREAAKAAVERAQKDLDALG